MWQKRQSELLKEEIEQRAKLERRKLSDMIRLLLERALKINDELRD